jgi:hypothetical protein
MIPIKHCSVPVFYNRPIPRLTWVLRKVLSSYKAKSSESRMNMITFWCPIQVLDNPPCKE